MQYRITINANSNGERYSFSYGSTKDIQLRCSLNKAVIEVKMTKDYRNNINDAYFTGLIKESVKRLALIHILKYERALAIEEVRLEITTNNEVAYDQSITESLNLYSMVEGNIYGKLPDSLKSDRLIKNIVSIQKSKAGSEIAALYAYIYSKNLLLETERFMYIWMAFNGFYNNLSESGERKEWKKIVRVLHKYNLGSEITPNPETKILVGDRVKRFISKFDEAEIKKQLIDENSYVSQEIRKLLYLQDGRLLNISAYGYIITDFAYYLRCTLFHANRPMLLFVFENDMDFKALRLANNLLGEFIDEHLAELFMEDYKVENK